MKLSTQNEKKVESKNENVQKQQPMKKLTKDSWISCHIFNIKSKPTREAIHSNVPKTQLAL